MGIAVDLGQHVAQNIADGEEEYASAKGEAAKRRGFGRADQVGEQQDRNERGHHVIEMAEMATRAIAPLNAAEGGGYGLENIVGVHRLYQ